MSVHKEEGGPAYVDACGRGSKPGFSVDVINGWPLIHRSKDIRNNSADEGLWLLQEPMVNGL